MLTERNARLLTLNDLGAAQASLFYQHWCGGCHSHGFPTLQALVQDPRTEDVGVAAVQTAFEGVYVKMLLDGEINAALVGDALELPERIDRWPLFEERYVLVLSRKHPRARQTVYACPEDRMAKSKRASLRGDFFQVKGAERSITIMTAGPLA